VNWVELASGTCGRADAQMTIPGGDHLDIDDVRRVLAGDTAAFAGIVGRWQRRLVNLAWRYCHDRSLAEDLAQEAFLKAFRSLHAFRGDSRFSTWLTAVGINVCRTWLRDRGPASTGLEHVVNDLRVAARMDALDAIRRDDVVRRLVSTLPARYREPIVLFYLNEKDLAETARTLGLPEGTVKARLHRGRAFLKRRLLAIWPDAKGDALE
jgi:RNA polymerase sigma-70 factor (ECF subfamily)